MPEPALRSLASRASNCALAEMLLSFDEITNVSPQPPTHHRPVHACQGADKINAIPNTHLLAFGQYKSPMAHPGARQIPLVGELALVNQCDDREPQGHATPKPQGVLSPSGKRTVQASGDDLAIPLRPPLIVRPQRPDRGRRRVCHELMFRGPQHLIVSRGYAQLYREHIATHLSASPPKQRFP